jgi:hypothetical protein
MSAVVLEIMANMDMMEIMDILMEHGHARFYDQ